MTKETFIATYVANFLAAYNATIYIEACMQGKHDRLRNPAIEDAIHMAEYAWDAWCEFKPDFAEPVEDCNASLGD